jgi:RpiB/LacA/LacB family sugar-phosphate isomerase
LSREHNDANILALGAWVAKPEDALKLVSTWLNTNYEGGRHVKRLEKIKQMEEWFGQNES